MRRGTTLVEVMVASVLLAIGVAGTLASLAGASRLRSLARARERVAANAHESLSWFVARGCASLDSLADSAVAERSGSPAIRQVVRRDSTTVALTLSVSDTVPLGAVALRVESVSPCS